MQPITNLSEGTGYAGAYQHIYLILGDFWTIFDAFILFNLTLGRIFWQIFHPIELPPRLKSKRRRERGQEDGIAVVVENGIADKEKEEKEEMDVDSDGTDSECR